MLALRPVNFMQIQQYFWDFQKKARTTDIPVEDSAQLIGIYDGELLVGYYALTRTDDNQMYIMNGYLTKEARHKKLASVAMKELEKLAVKAGYNRIDLASSRPYKSYTQFMHSLGYTPQYTYYSKDLTNGKSC